MKHATILIILICTTLAIRAETQYERDFRQLKEQRIKAIADATAQIDRKYAKSLEPLLVRASQATQVELALEIKKEIKSVSDGSLIDHPHPLAGHWIGTIGGNEPTDFVIREDGTAQLNIRPGKCVIDHNSYRIKWDNGVVWRLPLAPSGDTIEFEQGGDDGSKWTKCRATLQK